MRRVFERALDIALALALATVPARADAFAAPASEAPPATEDDALAAAKAWHNEADAKYNTADYEGAITAWQKAFAALPHTPEANTYRSLILYNIAAAHEKLYALRGDVEQLKKAKILLERFEASIDEIWAGAPEDGEKERAQVKAKLASIDQLIADARKKDDAPVNPRVDEPPPERPASPTKTASTDAPPRERGAGRGVGVGVGIGGGVLIGLGVVAGIGMIPALVQGQRANDLDDIADDDLDAREDRFDQGRRANAGAIAAGVISAVFLASGITLVVVGAKKRRAPRTAIAPVVGRGLAGVSVGGRF